MMLMTYDGGNEGYIMVKGEAVPWVGWCHTVRRKNCDDGRVFEDDDGDV